MSKCRESLRKHTTLQANDGQKLDQTLSNLTGLQGHYILHALGKSVEFVGLQWLEPHLD